LFGAKKFIVSYFCANGYFQIFNGVKVFGGELKVIYDDSNNGQVVKVTNGFLPVPPNFSVVPSVSEEEAIDTVILTNDADNNAPISKQDLSTPVLLIFKAKLHEGIYDSPFHLVWRVRHDKGQVTYLVDAQVPESVVEIFFDSSKAMKRQVIDYPTESTIWSEGDSLPTSSADVDAILGHTKKVYDLFNNLARLDSFDNQGASFCTFLDFSLVC